MLSKLTLMFLIILGLIIFGVTGIIIKNNVALHRYGKIGRLIGALFILFGILISSIVQIDAGEIGIKVLFGSVKNDVLHSGLHLVNPLYEIRKVDIKTQNYTMSGVHDEGEKAGEPTCGPMVRHQLGSSPSAPFALP